MLKLIGHFRIYESLQGIAPVFIGVLLNTSEPLAMKFLWLILLAFIQQNFIYLFNDFSDVKADLANPRKRDVLKFEKNKLLLPILVLMGAISLVMPITFPLKSMIFLQIGFLAAVFYSMPKIRLKNRVFWPSLLHFIFGLSYFLAGLTFVKGSINFIDLTLALYFGLILLSGGLFNELMDFDFDKSFKKKSLISLFGKKNIFYSFIFTQISAVLILFAYLDKLVLVFFLATYIIMLNRWWRGSYSQSILLKFRPLFRTFFILLTLSLYFTK